MSEETSTQPPETTQDERAPETAERASAPNGESAALGAFRAAASTIRGYRGFLDGLGVDPAKVTELTQVPFTDKRTVFGGSVGDWLVDGELTNAAELMTSSGQSGAFSIGVMSAAEREEGLRTADEVLRQIGAGPDTTTLLVNCLPMGIAPPTSLATVATPSVHLGMALEILTRLGPSYDRTVILAEPLFLKELAETGIGTLGAEWAANLAACFVGGEFVPESLRRYLAELLGLAEPSPARAGIFVSMGAAELGLHAFFETPRLRAARAALDTAASRRALFGHDPGYSPSLFAHDPTRVYVEERLHTDGARTLACTTLRPRMLPLVRYDLEDLGQVVPARALNRELERVGSTVRLVGPVIAVWGRRGAEIGGRGWRLRAETVKERLFGTAAHASALTGRFRLEERGGMPALHAQLRYGRTPDERLERYLRHLLESATGVPGQVITHELRDYPFHAAGDFQHKARYLALGDAQADSPSLRVAARPPEETPRIAYTDRIEDVDEALALLHDRFVDAGYMRPRPSGRRLIAPYLNPGTAFAVAEIDSETVGTIALIEDGPFGLPSDRSFMEEIDDLRARSEEPVREVGSLATRAGQRGSAGISLQLVAAIVRLGLREFPKAPVLISVTPAASRLYATLLGADQLAEPRPLYGAPAVLLATTGETLLEAALTHRTSRHESFARLITQTFPRWLTDRRERKPWPRAWLRPLLDESGLPADLAAKAALLAGGPTP